MTKISRHAQGLLYEIDSGVIAQGDGAILKTLIGDQNLEEIMRNGNGEALVVVHRQHGPCRVNATLSEEACFQFGQQMARHNERILDENQPILDGVLPDGSRINVVIPPAARRGVSFTIRKFFKTPLSIIDLMRQGMSSKLAAFLWTCVDGLGHKPSNMLVVGGTGSGKTATLGALSYLIPASSRCVLIEDTPEVRLPQPNTVGLVTTANSNMVELMRSALRMRPDRIIVGEVRGAEAKVLFEAMNTGHDGCIGTIHANSARESLHRIRSEPMNIPLAQCVGLHLVVVQRKLPDGSRAMVEISEIAGFGEGVVRMNQLFALDAKNGRVLATGIPSRLLNTIAQAAGLNAQKCQAVMSHREKVLNQALASQVQGDDLLTFLSTAAKA